MQAARDNIGVQFDVAQGATLDDQSQTPLTFTANNSTISIEGTMLLKNGPNTGVPLFYVNAGVTGAYINVSGGSLKYAGVGGKSDISMAPICVINGGTLSVTSTAGQGQGAILIVQGAADETQNASVYMVDGTIQLSQAATLEADNDYRQDGGTLMTTDTTACNLVDGKSGSIGTAQINGGTVWIDNQPNSYGRLNVMGSLNFMGELHVSIQGYVQQIPKVQGTSDLLYVAGTLYLNPESSSLSVVNNSAQKGDYWVVINSPNAITEGFRTVTINPDAPLLYGSNGGNYEISY